MSNSRSSPATSPASWRAASARTGSIGPPESRPAGAPKSIAVRSPACAVSVSGPMGESTTSMQSLVVAMSSSLLRDTHILPRAARSFSRVSASAAAPRLVWTGWPKPASPRGLPGYTRVTMIPDYDTCYRAIQSRDPRFDGCFFVAVSSTRIYCRPSCPAAMPKPEHVSFLPTAAAAQAAGYRACLRCRPDATPGSPEWNLRADVAGRAMRLIADGVVDLSLIHI